MCRERVCVSVCENVLLKKTCLDEQRQKNSNATRHARTPFARVQKLVDDDRLLSATKSANEILVYLTTSSSMWRERGAWERVDGLTRKSGSFSSVKKNKRQNQNTEVKRTISSLGWNRKIKFTHFLRWTQNTWPTVAVKPCQQIINLIDHQRFASVCTCIF